MQAFERAHRFVAEWEGGYINHPNDPGGATNYGVSLRWLRDTGTDVNGDGGIDINDIRGVTPELAANIFRYYFWDYLQLDDLPPYVAAVVYDSAVNTGCVQAVRFLQRSCNRFEGQWLSPDGRLGPVTRARLRNLCPDKPGQLVLCRALIDTRTEFYRQLAANPPSGKNYQPFLRGWLNRAESLWNFVNAWAAEPVLFSSFAPKKRVR